MFQTVIFAILATRASGARMKREVKLAVTRAPAQKVDGLYTFGAPCVSKRELRNPASSDGCFPGIRFVTQQPGKVDAVPAILTFGWDHPLMTKVRLDDKKVA